MAVGYASGVGLQAKERRGFIGDVFGVDRGQAEGVEADSDA